LKWSDDVFRKNEVGETFLSETFNYELILRLICFQGMRFYLFVDVVELITIAIGHKGEGNFVFIH